MKLFKSLLTTSAVLGLLAPITATAAEVNIDEINSYIRKKSSSKKQFNIQSFSKDNTKISENFERIDSEINEFEAGSFSETTTMSGSAYFQLGAVNEGATTQALTATYSYDIDLNTSFSGEDNFYVGIETGNSASVDFATDNSGSEGDSLTITSMYYQFPMGNFDVAIGPKLDNDDLLPTITSKYSDSFFFGSQYALPVNYYVLNTTGAGIAVARSFDNGWNVSGSLISPGASSNAGLLTKEGADVITLSVGYDSEKNYGGGIIWTDQDTACGVISSYSANICTQITSLVGVDESMNTTSIGGYWNPGGGKYTYSATTNLIDLQAPGIDIDFLADFQIGLDREMGNGVLSASWKSFPFVRVPDLNAATIKGDDLGSYVEVYYTYNLNDSVQIKPGLSLALPTSDSSSTTTDDLSFYLLDRTAIGIETSFKF